MTQAQVKFIYEVAKGMGCPKARYLQESKDLNEELGYEPKWKSFIVPYIEGVNFIHSEITLTSIDPLLSIKKLKNNNLYEVLMYGNREYSATEWFIIFNVRGLIMLGYSCVAAIDILSKYSGIFLKDEESNNNFVFLKLEEFLKNQAYPFAAL